MDSGGGEGSASREASFSGSGINIGGQQEECLGKVSFVLNIKEQLV